MNNAKKAMTRANVPSWMAWFYGVFSAWLIPWILYLQFTLPEQRSFIQWRAMWVIFDVALLAVSLIATYFLCKKSLWASLVLAALAALLAGDTWFDIMTSPAADKLVAIVTDMFIEIPVAILSMWCAFYILRQVADLGSRGAKGE